MATSGTIYGSTVGGGYRLEIDWSYTQSTTNNTSTVTASVYWCSLGSSYTISSSSTKTGSTTIDGTVNSWSVAGAGLSGNQRRLLATDSKTVTHNSDGTKSISLSAVFNCAVSLSSYVSSVSASGSITLNTIPRASTLTSSANWTAGSDFTINVSRASTSFTHTAKIYVNGVFIKSVGSIPTLGSSVFSTAENASIFTQLAQTASKSTKITLETYNGGTLIGSNDYTGTVTAPNATTLSASSFTIGSSTTITLSNEKNSNFVYDLTASIGSYTAPNILTKADFQNPTWDTSGSVSTGMLGQLATSNSGTVTYTLTTYWANGATYVKVRSSTTTTVTASVDGVAQAPTFTTTGITYADTNSTITGITGNNQYIVQNKSTLVVTLASANLAVAKTGTTMKEYQCTFNGSTVTVAHPATPTNLTFTFDSSKLNVTTNQNVVIKAVDKRLNSTSVSVNVNVVTYDLPLISANATRQDGFGDSTTISLSGSISPLSVGGVNKNAIVSMQYQYRVKGGTYNTLTSFTSGSAVFPNFLANNVVLTLSNTSAWDIYIVVTDKLGSVNVTKSVGVGQPILFMDTVKSSVGVNTFPSISNSFEVTGNFKLTGQLASYLNMNYNALVFGDTGANGDVSGTNFDHIWFDDTTNTFHFSADTTYKATGNANISVGSMDVGAVNATSTLKISKTGGQVLNLVQTDWTQSVTGSTGTYNYVAFSDSTGSWKSYLGYPSAKDGVFFINNSGVGDITFYPKVKVNVTGDLNVSGNITNPSKIGGTLLNGWANFGSGYQPLAYWKDKNGIVHLEGLVNGGSGVITNLPSGYRPENREIFSSVSNNAIGRIDVLPTGDVQMSAGSNTWISLSGISFKAVN